MIITFMKMTKMKTECNCKKCNACCLNIPGIPTPSEIVEQAKFLKLSVKKYLETYCISGYRDFSDTENYIFAYPARRGFEGKKENWGYPLGSGPCTFYNEKLGCKIHSVKPLECRKSFGCKPNKISYRLEALKIWKKELKLGTIHKDILTFINR